MRRRPLGRTIVDICLDLAVLPGFCTGAFWNELFDLTRCYGGSITTLVQERWRREQAFIGSRTGNPTHDRLWLDQRREAIRQTLGCLSARSRSCRAGHRTALRSITRG
jgi:hypothetical protein